MAGPAQDPDRARVVGDRCRGRRTSIRHARGDRPRHQRRGPRVPRVGRSHDRTSRVTSAPPRLAAPATEPDAETVAAVGQIVDLVRRIRVPGALNLYDEAAGRAWGDEPGEATRRALALRGHLVAHWAAPTVLVGEAPGQ